MLRTAFLFAFALFAAGCSSLPPEDLFELDEGRKLLDAGRKPHPSGLGVAVALSLEEMGRSREDFGNAAQVAVDGLALRARTASALARLGLFNRVVELGGETLMDQDADYVKLAREGGLDWLLVVRPTKSRVSYRGRNGWFLPSLAVWVLFWFPSLWIADEDFAAEVSFNAALLDARNGREAMRGDWSGDFETALNDFQRNLHFWGILRVPGCLSVDDYEDLGEILLVHAFNRAALAMLKDLAVFASSLPKTPAPDPGPKNGGPAPDPPDKPAEGGAAPDSGKPEVEPVPAKPARKAVVVGAGEFGNGKSPPVPFAGADAKAFAGHIAARDGFDAADVTLLTGPEATLGAVKAAVDAFAGAKGRDDDLLVFYFSGRGFSQPSAAGDRLFLALSDTDPGNLQASALSLSDLRANLSRRKCRVRLILDTSFAGGRTPRSAETGSRDPAGTISRLLAGKDDWACLFAAGNGGAAHELREESQGLFTHFLIRGMAGEAEADGSKGISLKELMTFIGDNVSAVADFLGEPQSPWAAARDLSSELLPAPE